MDLYRNRKMKKNKNQAVFFLTVFGIVSLFLLGAMVYLVNGIVQYKIVSILGLLLICSTLIFFAAVIIRLIRVLRAVALSTFDGKDFCGDRIQFSKCWFSCEKCLVRVKCGGTWVWAIDDVPL